MQNRLMGLAGVLVVGLILASCVTQESAQSQTSGAGRTPAAKSASSDLPDQKASPPAKPSLAGDWSGAIVAAGQTIQVHLRFTESGGTPNGTIDIPEQHAYDLPLVDISYQPPKISFVLHAGSDVARFQGKVEGEHMSGSFTQGPVSGTFAVNRTGSAHPSSPAPAATSEGSPIELKTPTGTLYGTLDLPSGRGPFPVALIIAGSGPTNRNGNSALLPGKNNSLLMLARALREHGIASVRYDKRGVGASADAMKSEANLTFSAYIDDAAAWIELLKHDPRFTKLAVIGHSEGSLIGMVAARIAGADAFVSIAGSGVPAGKLLKEQLANEPVAIRTKAFSIIDSLEAGKEVKKVSPELMPLFRPSVQRYLISWFHYDPRKEIAQLTVPVLILQGTTDLQVPVKDAEELHAAQPRSTLDIIDGMNHIMKLAPKNRQQNFATYTDPNLPLAPKLVKDLTDFLGSVL